MISRMLYDEYEKSLKDENRFFIDEKFRSMFDRIIEEYESILPKNLKLYRGRLHPHYRLELFDSVEEIGMPDPNVFSTNGRANPIGINYLYLSSNVDTVIAELRPNIGDTLTVGTFKTSKDLRLIELELSACIGGTIGEYPSAKDISDFMMYLLLAFTRPIDVTRKQLEYLPTQYFTEYCKTKGYDGISFLSSVMEKNSTLNKNYVFFNSNNLELLSVNGKSINDVKYSHGDID